MTISELNQVSQKEFVRVIGPVFEHSPWIAEMTFTKNRLPIWKTYIARFVKL